MPSLALGQLSIPFSRVQHSIRFIEALTLALSIYLGLLAIRQQLSFR